MTISAYTGTPGSGKSYRATEEIYYSICKRLYPIPTICNYELSLPKNQEYFHYYPNSALNPQMLVNFASDWWRENPFKEDRILLVIDEAQLVFNSRDWQDENRMAWLEFFSQHRHYGYKVILIAQSAAMIDKQFRSLIEYDVNHRTLGNFGVVGSILSALTLGRAHAAVTRYYGLHERLGAKFFVTRKKIYSLYDTRSAFTRI